MNGPNDICRPAGSGDMWATHRWRSGSCLRCGCSRNEVEAERKRRAARRAKDHREIRNMVLFDLDMRR